MALLLLLALVAGACGSDDGDSSSATTAPADKTTTTAASGADAEPVRVMAGLNDPGDKNIAVLAFLPATITVSADQKVVWDWSDSTEAHSVTFAAGGKTPPPGPPDQKLFAPTPATGPYDGSALVNSGLQPLGPTPPKDFELTFSKPGTYQYFCAIHPNMTGTVKVEAGDAKVDSAADVTSRGKDEAAKWLAEGRAAKQKFTATPARKQTQGSATTWFVEMGTSTPHTDVLAFSPVPVNLKPGDQVTFVNSSQAPHTATFGPVPPSPLDPKVVNPAPGPSPQTLAASGYFNTGQLPPDAPPGAGPPLPARSFTFKVPAAGDYSYVCVLHVASGMVGRLSAA